MTSIVAIFISALIILPARAQANDGASEVFFAQNLGARLPLETWLTDENGRGRTLGSYFTDKPVIVVFTYFRCPNLCTLVLNGLTKAITSGNLALGRDFSILTVSIDPKEDTRLALAKKRSYLARLEKSGDASAGWSFTTATREQIAKLTAAAGFHFRYDPKSRQYFHPSGVIVASPEGRISQYFFGIKFDETLLQNAIREASRDRTGSWIEPVLLYCFHYDPARSAGGAKVMTAIRLCGIAGLFALVIFFLFVSGPRMKRRQA